jgi:hypothetical protein
MIVWHSTKVYALYPHAVISSHFSDKKTSMLP